MNFRQIVKNTLQNNLKPLTPVLDGSQEWYHTQYKVYHHIKVDWLMYQV